LDAAGSGIEVADLTIADLHPPYAFKDQPDYTAADRVKRGPASAYENVVSMREYKETVLDYGMTAQIMAVNQAHGEAAAAISQAQAYQYSTIAKAQGEAARMTTLMEGREGMKPDEGALFDRLARTETLYNSLKDALAPIQKIVVDPRVKDVQLYQTTANGPQQLRPPGQ
jgi:regulator of protease activity HflC (stomatin/prohibitin superfamily)